MSTDPAEFVAKLQANRAPPSLRRRLVSVAYLAVFTLSALVLVNVGWLAYRDMATATEADRWQTHSYVVIGEFDDLLSSLKDAETGQRGFVITGDPQYLAPYRASLSQIDAHLSHLRRLTADNPRQEQRLAALTPLVAAKLAELKTTITLRQSQGFETTRNLMQVNAAKHLMEQLRDAVAEAEQVESRLLTQRTGAKESNARKTIRAIVVGGSLGILAIVLLFVWLRLELSRRARAEDALVEHRDHLQALVAARTHDLAATNGELRAQMTAREQTQAALAAAEREMAAIALRNKELEGRAVKEELAATLELFGMMVKNVRSLAIVTLDPLGNLTTWNDAAEELTGYKAAEVIGQHFSLFYPPERRAEHWPESDLRIALADARFEGEGWQVRKDGTHFWANLVITPLYDAAGQHRGFGKVTRDFSERHAAEQALRVSEERLRAIVVELALENKRAELASRTKSEFLANMSHELRTPLNAIIGFAELLHAGEVGLVDLQQKEFLGDILTSSKQLLGLLKNMLDFAALETGTVELRSETLDMAEVMAEVCETLSVIAEAKQITIVREVAPDVGAVVTDPAKLKQILYNFVSNAVKFTPTGGHVTVRAKTGEAGELCLEVEDTGIGISSADIANLFVEFQQLEMGVGKKFQGTGLGLALVKRIVTAMGGRVDVRSEPGKGSVFSAILPRSQR